uniref:CSON009630 protein n=1 Tax=Culicoides sonorensis TaxID=179676 RepID=A0A336M183_CULSO
MFRAIVLSCLLVAVSADYYWTPKGNRIVGVVSKINHPRYGSSGFDWDVSIMKLESPLTFNSAVQPIKLAPAGLVVPDGENLVTLVDFDYEIQQKKCVQKAVINTIQMISILVF